MNSNLRSTARKGPIGLTNNQWEIRADKEYGCIMSALLLSVWWKTPLIEVSLYNV